MEIQKLEIFIDLTKTQNYTETAERQYTTQGNVSKQIIALEKELAVKLFHRSHRTIELTEAGKLALPYAKKVVEQYYSLKETLREYETERNLMLTVYSIPTMPNYEGFSRLTDFVKQHPEIQVQLKESESAALVPFPWDGNSTIVFARTFSPLAGNFETIMTEKDQFVALLPEQHTLARKNNIHLSQLQNDNFLLLGKETNLYEPVIDLCHQVGFHPNITYKGTRIDLIMNMVSNEFGVSIVMEKTVTNLLTDKVVIVPITPNKTTYLSFIRRNGEHALASDLFWYYLQNDAE